MVFIRRQTQSLINQFNKITINQQLKMAAPINYVISPFEGNINSGDPTGINFIFKQQRR